VRSGLHLQNTQITVPKVTQGFTNVKVESRSNALQHRSSFLGYGCINAKLNQGGYRTGGGAHSTRLCAPGVRKQHPGHNLIGHPFPQLDQHGLVPFARTRLQNMRFDMFIAYARNE
jgi:hypothetical protein